MRYAVLLLCSVLIGGTYAVAQATPASKTASTSSSSAQALPAPPPLHPLTVAQAREILKLTGADRLRNQVMRRMMTGLQGVFPPYMPKDVVQDLEKNLEAIDMDSITVKIYQEHISEKDAAAIIAFYKTPAGQRMLKVMPVIVKETQEAGEKAGERVGREVVERHMAEIKAAAKKYEEEHSKSSSSSPQ
jgi:uncharacterized protein